MQAQRERQFSSLKRNEPGRRIHILLVNAFRRFLGDRLDLHAAVLTGHDDGPTRCAIEDDAQIQLPRNRHPLLDQQTRHFAALRPGLMRHECHAMNLIRELVGFSRIGCELDASTFASPAGVNLRLDDDGAAAEALGDSLRLG